MSTVRARFVRRDLGPHGCPSGRHHYEIVHRASGRVAGRVAPWGADFELNGRVIWNAYSAAPEMEDGAINGTDERLEEAIGSVLDPSNVRPFVSDKSTEAESRAKDPEGWAFYDWLVSVTREDNAT